MTSSLEESNGIKSPLSRVKSQFPSSIFSAILSCFAHSGHLALETLVTGVEISTHIRPCNGQLSDDVGDVIAIVVTTHEKLSGCGSLHPVNPNTLPHDDASML